MHEMRDDMNDQLEHIDQSLNETDLEKPDTTLSNLGMECNDDLIDVLKVHCKHLWAPRIHSPYHDG